MCLEQGAMIVHDARALHHALAALTGLKLFELELLFLFGVLQEICFGPHLVVIPVIDPFTVCSLVEQPQVSVMHHVLRG
jgi:hypothetical protein